MADASGYHSLESTYSGVSIDVSIAYVLSAVWHIIFDWWM